MCIYVNEKKTEKIDYRVPCDVCIDIDFIKIKDRIDVIPDVEYTVSCE